MLILRKWLPAEVDCHCQVSTVEHWKIDGYHQVLEGKMTTCTLIAEEQADFIKCQLDTIHKLEDKWEKKL